MRYLLGLSLPLLLWAGAGAPPAAADGFKFLSTTYRTCLEDTEGFDQNLQPIPLPSPLPAGTHFLRLTTQGDSGQTTLNLDGTLSSSFDGTSVRNPNVGNTQINTTHSDCTGTWTFDAPNQTLQTQSTCTFANTAGGTNTGTVTGLTATYRLAGTTLVRSGPEPPVVETVHVDQNGATAAFNYQRVCNRSAALFFSP